MTNHEKLIWELLIQVGVYNVDVFIAVKEFFSKIDWDKIEGLPLLEKTWFETTLSMSWILQWVYATNKPLEHDVWESTDIHKVHTLGEPPEGWPLKLNLEIEREQPDGQTLTAARNSERKRLSDDSVDIEAGNNASPHRHAKKARKEAPPTSMEQSDDDMVLSDGKPI